MENPMYYHAVTRTSPRGPGEKFLGRCVLCQQTNLPLSAALEPCPNLTGQTFSATLIQAIEGEEEEEK